MAIIDTGYVYPGGDDYRGLLREVPVADQARPVMARIPGWVRNFNELLAGPPPVIDTGVQCRRPFECPFSAFCEGRELGGQLSVLAPPQEAAREWPDPALGTLDPAAPEFLATLAYPRYYLDFETVQFAVPRWAGTRPFQQLVFQWSCHVEHGPDELEHREFLDTSGDAPMRAAAESMLEGPRAPTARSSSTTTSRSGGWWRWGSCSRIWRRRSTRWPGASSTSCDSRATTTSTRP